MVGFAALQDTMIVPEPARMEDAHPGERTGSAGNILPFFVRGDGNGGELVPSHYHHNPLCC